jgi:hypothetical protein
MGKARTPSECPVCGADVPLGAKACPECGADERTGWNDEMTRYDGVDLPDEAFEENSSVQPRHSREHLTRTGVPYLTWIVAVGLLAVLGALLVFGAL